MKIKELINNLELVLITADSVSYEANDSHLSNIGSDDFVQIDFFHEGKTSLTFGTNGVTNENTRKFYDDPTAKDLYDFVDAVYNGL